MKKWPLASENILCRVFKGRLQRIRDQRDIYKDISFYPFNTSVIANTYLFLYKHRMNYNIVVSVYFEISLVCPVCSQSAIHAHRLI